VLEAAEDVDEGDGLSASQWHRVMDGVEGAS
jgi:hypothetical protein